MNNDRDKERKAGKIFHLGMSLAALAFGVVWCLMALSMGAWVMLIFGIPFVGLLAYRLVMVAKLAEKNQDPMPQQEMDPWDQQPKTAADGWCPYCGASVENDFAYCPKCGRKLK